MVTNSSSDPATDGNGTHTGLSGNDILTGGAGNDNVTGGAGNDILAGDGPVEGAWHYETFDYDFTSAHGQAFDMESGTRTGAGYVTDFNEGNLTNSLRGTTGNPENFGVVYTSTLNTTLGGTYRLTTASDDGSTIQVFDSDGNAVNFANQLGGTLDYMNNDRHQGTTSRYGDVELDPNETYTIQIRYWENQGGDTLTASISGPDTGNATESLLTTDMIGMPPGLDQTILATPAGVEGNDILDGGAGDDTIDGNGGDDTITGGLDDDTLTGGDGNDTFVYNVGDGDDIITDFNTGTGQDINDLDQTNNDLIDLSSFYTDIYELRADFEDDGVLNQSTGDFTDNTDIAGGSLTFTGITDKTEFTYDNTNVACFTCGTLIETPNGPTKVENLNSGDLVDTADHGPQPIRWIGCREVASDLDFAPVRFAKGAVGNQSAFTVSPQHRMLIGGWQAELLFGSDQVLVAAKHMCNDTTIRRIYGGNIRYHHMLFDQHELVFAHGTVSESFHPSKASLDGLGQEARNEVLTLFPELEHIENGDQSLSRIALKAVEADVLLSVMAKKSRL
jgi:hypothetical protein